MVLRITPPTGEKVARCRWPTPDFRKPAGTATMRWGRRAWEWAAAWCPLTLAQIPDPVQHDARQDQMMNAAEEEIIQALQGRTLPPGETIQDRAEEAMFREWVRVSPEVATPVWNPGWTDIVRFTAPIRRQNPDGTWTVIETERLSATLDQLATEAVFLWAQAPDDDTRYDLVAPSTMQSILDVQIPALHRHLIWDLAARKARETYPDDPRYRPLRSYPSPPY